MELTYCYLFQTILKKEIVSFFLIYLIASLVLDGAKVELFSHSNYSKLNTPTHPIHALSWQLDSFDFLVRHPNDRH